MKSDKKEHMLHRAKLSQRFLNLHIGKLHAVDNQLKASAPIPTTSATTLKGPSGKGHRETERGFSVKKVLPRASSRRSPERNS